jgi:hypothetical protein
VCTHGCPHKADLRLRIINQKLLLQDSSDTNGGALYVKAITGDIISGGIVQNIVGGPTSGDTLNIYYDPAFNPTLGPAGTVYNFASGHGALIGDAPVPLPPSALLLGSGLLGLGLLGWRRKRLMG